jgi:arsenate reductase (glutaredoxin)
MRGPPRRRCLLPRATSCQRVALPNASILIESRAMSVRVYHYPKCSTCRKALKWLTEAKLTFEAIDLVAHPIPAAELRSLQARSGLPIARFFNTSGESYRAGGFKDRLKSMTDSEAFNALAKDGKLVKRPIVDTGESVLVGFDEAAYAKALHRRA